MRKTFLQLIVYFLAISILSGLIVGIGSGWKFHANLENSGVYDDGGASPTETLLWNYQIEITDPTDPVISNGIVFLGSSNNNIYALDAISGNEIWRFQTGDSVQSTPAIIGGVVYFGGDDEYVYALDAKTGKEIWKYNTGHPVVSSPAVSNDIVYIGGYGDSLYALDAKTGKEIWRYKTENSVRSNPAISNNTVYFGSNYYLYALNAATGDEIWKYKAEGRLDDSNPAVSNNMVFVGSSDNNVYALDAGTGREIWKYETYSSIYSTPAISNDIVYVTSDDNTLYAIDAKKGFLKWKFIAEFYRNTPAVYNGIVYVGSQDDNLYALDAISGRKIWEFNTGSSIRTSPAISDGIIYITTGNVTAIGVPSLKKSPEIASTIEIPLIQSDVTSPDSLKTEENALIHYNNPDFDFYYPDDWNIDDTGKLVNYAPGDTLRYIGFHGKTDPDLKIAFITQTSDKNAESLLNEELIERIQFYGDLESDYSSPEKKTVTLNNYPAVRIEYKPKEYYYPYFIGYGIDSGDGIINTIYMEINEPGDSEIQIFDDFVESFKQFGLSITAEAAPSSQKIIPAINSEQKKNQSLIHYNNPDFNFYYPDDWNIDDTGKLVNYEPGDTFRYIGFHGKTDPDLKIAFITQTSDKNAESLLNEELIKRIQFFGDLESDYSNPEKKTVTINNYPAIRIAYEPKEYYYPYFLGYGIDTGDGIIHIIYMEINDPGDTDIQIFDDFVESITGFGNEKTSSSGSQEIELAEEYYKVGREYLDLKKYEEAIQAYDKAIGIDPEFAKAWNNKGVALKNLQKYDESIEAYEKAIEIDPDCAPAWNNIGFALADLGKNEEAINAFDKAIEINPDNSLAWNNKGVALEKFGKNNDAIKAYNEALKIDPNNTLAKTNRDAAIKALNTVTPTDTLSVTSDKDIIKAGESITISIKAGPEWKYYIWLSDISAWDHPAEYYPTIEEKLPVDLKKSVFEFQEGVELDTPEGPYILGNYHLKENKENWIRNIVPNDEDYHGTRYYAEVTLDEKGQRDVTWVTTKETKPGKYTIKVENKGDFSDEISFTVQDA